VLTITVLADRPELAQRMWEMPNSWPEFMRHDPIGGLFYRNVESQFADYVLVGVDPDGEVVATAYSVPFVLDGDELPDNGWDFAIRSGLLARLEGEQPDAISAVEIAVRPDRQGTGLSGQMPVRPSHKPDVHEPMATYAFRTRPDGLPDDPWLRVHVRAGGRIDKVAPRSMCVPGTLAEWRDWTGLPFDTTGPVEVPKALAPVHCDAEHGIATYVEPNVWVRHRTGA
jgi:hypothetical protein